MSWKDLAIRAAAQVAATEDEQAQLKFLSAVMVDYPIKDLVLLTPDGLIRGREWYNDRILGLALQTIGAHLMSLEKGN